MRLTVDAASVVVGFYGKLPSLGDFVGRRVPDPVLQGWDAWMQASLERSRAGAAPDWTEIYLTAPMWRFAAAAGGLHAQPVAGVVFPSVDRVGRCFPVTVFAFLPAEASPLAVATHAADWFERVEDLVLAQFEEPATGLDGLDGALLALTPRLESALAAARAPAADPPRDLAPGVAHLHFPLGGRADLAPAAVSWLDRLLQAREPRSVHWWTSGSAQVRPSWLVTQGYPEPAAFAAMLNGTWHQWPWSSCEVAPAATTTSTAPARLHYESAGTTHPGKARTENQDSWTARPEIGVWAVADGMGGHDHGSLASHMTRDALNSVAAGAGLAAQVQSVRAALEQANEYLYAMSLRPVNPITSGSTVVALVARGQDAVCLWAGDSRLYRLRAGRLEQLTTDHSDDAEGESTNVITRAIGGHHGLELDQRDFGVLVGDRFLLCSDGLYRDASAAEITRLLGSGDALSATQALRDHVLRGRASDNLTAVVVDVQPAAGT